MVANELIIVVFYLRAVALSVVEQHILPLVVLAKGNQFVRIC